MPSIDVVRCRPSTRCGVTGLEAAVGRGARRCCDRTAWLTPARSRLTWRAPPAADVHGYDDDQLSRDGSGSPLTQTRPAGPWRPRPLAAGGGSYRVLAGRAVSVAPGPRRAMLPVTDTLAEVLPTLQTHAQAWSRRATQGELCANTARRGQPRNPPSLSSRSWTPAISAAQPRVCAWP